MVVRTWKGATRLEDKGAYVEYLHETGFREYRQTPGNLGVLGLCRAREGRAEFLLVTLWESWRAVDAFAGPDTSKAVFYPEDDDFLVERDDHVDHYEVVFLAGDADPGSGLPEPAAGRPLRRALGWFIRGWVEFAGQVGDVWRR